MVDRYKVSLAHQGCSHGGFVVWEERATARSVGPAVVSLPRGFVHIAGDDGTVEILCSGCAQTVASASRSMGSDSDPGFAKAAVLERPDVEAAALPLDDAPEITEPSAPPEIEAEVAAVLRATERGLGQTEAPQPDTDLTEAGALSADATDPGVARAQQEASSEAAATPMPDALAAEEAAPTLEASLSDEGGAIVTETAAEPMLSIALLPRGRPPSDPKDPSPDAVPAAVEAALESTPDAADVPSTDSLLTPDQSVEALFAEHPDVPPVRGDAIPNHLFERLRHMAARLRTGE